MGVTVSAVTAPVPVAVFVGPPPPLTPPGNIAPAAISTITPEAQAAQSEGSLSGGALAVIIIVIVIAAILALALACFCCHVKKQETKGKPIFASVQAGQSGSPVNTVSAKSANIEMEPADKL